MARSPRWKVCDASGNYQASFHEIEAAAAIMGFYGYGATIRDGHALVVWREGKESQPASESYDFVATLVLARIAIAQERRQAADNLKHANPQPKGTP